MSQDMMRIIEQVKNDAVLRCRKRLEEAQNNHSQITIYEKPSPMISNLRKKHGM